MDKLYKDFLAEKYPIMRNEKHQYYKTKINIVTAQLRKTKISILMHFLKKTKVTLKKHGKALGT